MVKLFRGLPLVFVRRCLLAAGVAASTGSGWSAAAAPVTVRERDGAIELENGRVRASFEGAADGVRQRFSARNAAGEWEVVLESLHPVRPLPAGANRLYDAGVGKDRYLANTLVTRGAVLSRSEDEAVVKLTGDGQGAVVTQTVRLRRGEPWFHTEVRAELPERPAKLEFLLSAFTFKLDRAPSFVHTPSLKFVGRWEGPEEIQVLGDRCFHSPAVILQEGGLFGALVPDLAMLNAQRVASPDARRQMLVPRNQFSVPVEADKYTMPSALDLDVGSGLTPQPVLSFGLMDYVVQHHIRYLHPHDGSMTRTLAQGTVGYGFDLFVGARMPTNLGYQLVSRHLWERFGHPVFTGQRHLAMPFADYATTIRDVIFQPLAVQPGVPGYPDTGAFLDFELDGRRVGGFRNAAPFWLDVLGNTEFWNNVRDATGMYEWGKRLGDPSLGDRARRIIELALAAPQNPQGLFPLIYRHPNLYPVGLGPENIDHEGHPQSAMRTSPSWGEGSGVFTGLAGVLRELGGAYVDATKRLAVGVDGVQVVRAELRGSVLEVELEAGLARLAQPWDHDYEISLRLAGLPPGRGCQLKLNQAAPVSLPEGTSCTVPLVVRADGAILVRPPPAAR